MKKLWERKKGVLIVLALPPLLIYLASGTSSQYGWMVATLYILAGIIVIFIATEFVKFNKFCCNKYNNYTCKNIKCGYHPAILRTCTRS